MSEYSIVQGVRPVAHADKCVELTLPGDDDWEGMGPIKCHFFGRVTLVPPVLFEHLAGTGLSRFFNGSEIVVGGKPPVRNLRYVHGRSEVMRGNHRISSVLLARPESWATVTDATWLVHLPALYKKFLSMRPDRAENT